MIICNINQFLNLICKNNKILMGIDLGIKKTGIAFSDPSKKFSLASKIIKNKKNTFCSEIIKLINDYDVGGIIMGIPLNDEKKINRMTQSIKDRTRDLNFCLEQKKIILPIIFWDESFSSFSAVEKIKNLINTKKKQKEIVDKFAAMEILQDFLNFKSQFNETKNN